MSVTHCNRSCTFRVALAQARRARSRCSSGDLPATETARATLLERAGAKGMRWDLAPGGVAFGGRGYVFIKRGDAVNGVALLRNRTWRASRDWFAGFMAEILRALAEDLAGCR